MAGRHEETSTAVRGPRPGGPGPGGPGRAARRPPARPPRRPTRVSRGYALASTLAAVLIVISGIAYASVSDVSDIGSSHAITSGPSTGAQNILLMGIESRRYFNGSILPAKVLAQLHAGNAQAVAAGEGGNDTNTLILIHLSADGKKATGFSIPRDDWVSFADTVGPQQTGKIDQAYGVSLFYKEQQLSKKDPSMSQDELAMQGNEAGQAAAVATVEKLTGVHIDHFAAVNLYGFYELAQVVGGVEVCLNHPVKDAKSGANFPAGRQHLNAAQALAFVRQRDGLPNGDLDRTHRQQAFLDSVIHQLDTQGVLSDLTRTRALLSVAKKYVITDSGWNLLDFAAGARGLTTSNLVFRTLPITGYETIDHQSANAVNPAQIKKLVNTTFNPPKKPASPKPTPRAKPSPKPAASATAPAVNPHGITVDVLNGGRIEGLARSVSNVLVSAGYTAGVIGNTTSRTATAVRYGAGTKAAAQRIAAALGTKAVAGPRVEAGHIDVLLGTSATVPSAAAVTGAAAQVSKTPAPKATSNGAQGGPVQAVNGIPCVN